MATGADPARPVRVRIGRTGRPLRRHHRADRHLAGGGRVVVDRHRGTGPRGAGAGSHRGRPYDALPHPHAGTARPIAVRVDDPLPHRHASARSAPRRGRAVPALQASDRGIPQPDGRDPDARPGGRQDGPLFGPAPRGEPVHGLAVDPPLLRAPDDVRTPDPGDPPRRSARPARRPSAPMATTRKASASARTATAISAR